MDSTLLVITCLASAKIVLFTTMYSTSIYGASSLFLKLSGNTVYTYLKQAALYTYVNMYTNMCIQYKTCSHLYKLLGAAQDHLKPLYDTLLEAANLYHVSHTNKSFKVLHATQIIL